MVTILMDELKTNTRTVQLSLSLESYNQRITMLVAHMGASWGATLVRIQEDISSDEDGNRPDQERISLSGDEITALVEAWTAFQADITAKREAEEAKLQTELDEAKHLADRHGITMKINPNYADNCYYRIRNEDPYYNDDYVDPSRVLSVVKTIVARMPESIGTEAVPEPEEENSFTTSYDL